MKDSKIFTKGELKTIEEFQEGNRRDKNGTFCNRVKPKLKEMQEYWVPNWKKIKKLIKGV